MKYTAEDLQKEYAKMTSKVVASCTLTSDMVGGLSADDDGLRAYIKHHLHLEGEDAVQALARIKAEELGVDVTPDTGELKEKKTYGVTVIRRTPIGPYIGNWMVKAMLKAACSRVGLFASKRGSKGDVAEMGRVLAVGISLLVPEHPDCIHLVDTLGSPAKTSYREFKGRISGPSGSMSIVSQKECAPSGSRFEFELRWYAGKLKEDDMVKVFAAAQIVGIGSAKAFECGKFTIDSLDIE